MLAEALEANRQLSELAGGLMENARAAGAGGAALARDAERDAELEKLRADLAVLQRMLFGRSSEKSRPEPRPAAVMMPLVADGQGRERGSGTEREAGPGGAGGAAGLLAPAAV